MVLAFFASAVHASDSGATATAPPVDLRSRQDEVPAVAPEAGARLSASVGLVRSAGGNGTGWVAGRDTVVTNEHVARTRTGDIYIDYSDGERVECYTAVADRDMDLAVLKCPTGGREQLSLVGPPPASSAAVVVGYPGGEGPVVTTGVFTGRSSEIRGARVIEFTAAIRPGSSGSPVFDPARGGVAAVATFGGGWGVPTEELAPLLGIAENYPASKSGAEWRLRLRRSALAVVIALPIAGFMSRRLGRNRPMWFTVRWCVIAGVAALAVTQVQFMLSGPAHFV